MSLKSLTVLLNNSFDSFPHQEVAAYGGYGSLEDSMQSCLSLIPQPPKKDFIKMLENDGKVLRYEAVLVSLKYTFLVTYFERHLAIIS